MEDSLSSSLGIYWVVYALFTNKYGLADLLIIGVIFPAIGWLSYAPRHGKPLGMLRLFWYIVIVYFVFITAAEEATNTRMLLWCSGIGMMLRFSYEVLYKDSRI